MTRHLKFTRVVVGDGLGGQTGAPAVEYLNAGLARLPSLPTDLPSYLVAEAPHAELARAAATPQARNLLAILLCAHGTPMLLAGE